MPEKVFNQQLLNYQRYDSESARLFWKARQSYTEPSVPYKSMQSFSNIKQRKIIEFEDKP